LLGLLSLLLMFIRRGRAAALLCCVALFWLSIWSLPVSHQWLYQKMTANYPPLPMEMLPKAQAIVVLGGGVYGPNAVRPWPDLNGAADRLWYAATLYHAGKAGLIVLSGGITSHTGEVSEAAAMAVVLRDLGVPEAFMLLEEESLNTRENAENAGKLLSGPGVDQILLVTSAMHMARAELEFRRQGFAVTAAPTDYSIEPLTGWRNYLPSTAALDGNASAFKEWLGRLVQGRV
jgi:uncharacterized SAM-binding protein YcdF (DUF218 family)